MLIITEDHEIVQATFPGCVQPDFGVFAEYHCPSYDPLGRRQGWDLHLRIVASL